MPSGVCPAFYDSSPSDVNKILSADIVISLGSLKMEGWFDSLLEYNQECYLIETSYMGEWNVPSNVKKYVDKIQDELSLILPHLKDTIQINTQIYLDKINETSVELQQKIVDNESVGKKVICMQWQKDFIEWLGLNVTLSYSSPESLSLQDELNIITAASNKDVYAVIDNLQSGTSFGARVASESGSNHIIFTNFPYAIPGVDTYLDMIKYNTEQLINGIETYEYKQGEITALEGMISELEVQRNASITAVVILGILAFVLIVLYKKK
jgi:ABC-type Zn uptake system ZnuABC Zn-binding protein ZnuA